MNPRELNIKVSAILLGGALALSSMAKAAADFSIGYSGRIVDSSGAPIATTITVNVAFFTAATGGNSLGSPLTYPDVRLTDGVFHLGISLTPGQVTTIFGDASQPVFL